MRILLSALGPQEQGKDARKGQAQGKAKLRDCTSLLFLPGAFELEGAEADGAGDRCWRACWIDAGMLEAFIADCTSL